MEIINTTSTLDPRLYYDYLNNYMMNPTILIIAVVVIIVFVLFSFSLGSGNNSDSTSYMGNSQNSNGDNTFVFIIIGILVILLLFNAFQYFFSINITAYIKNLFKPNTQLEIVVNKPKPFNKQKRYQKVKQEEEEEEEEISEIKTAKQVFNIPGNYYNYKNAKAICTAYGANLATYSQIENSYNDGGEWCNYGWSEDQMALFPTQQKTYNHLQQIAGHEHDCGRPGINGGYMANPNLQFGVNCYGYKPKMTKEENKLMETIPRYPQSNENIEFDKRVDYWKKQINNILVSPFNSNTWSQI
jgi:preprotein translocase subunit SecG